MGKGGHNVEVWRSVHSAFAHAVPRRDPDSRREVGRRGQRRSDVRAAIEAEWPPLPPYEAVNLSIFSILDLSQIKHLADVKSAKTGNIHILYGPEASRQ
jgi:hypothetical protein